MSHISILFLVCLSAAVIAAPFENGHQEHGLTERLSDNYLVQLYERFLQIHPPKRPDRKPQQSTDSSRVADPNSTEEKVFDDQLDELSVPQITQPAKKEDQSPESRTLEKDALEVVDGEGNQPKAGKAKEQPEPRGARRQADESDNSRHHSTKELDKQDRHQGLGVEKLPNKENARSSPLVQINVNVASGPIESTA